MAGEFQKVIEQTISDTIPNLIWIKVIRRKFEQAGVNPSKKLVQKIAQQFQNRKEDTIELPKKYNSLNIDFTFTDDDEKFLEEAMDGVTDRLVSEFGAAKIEKMAHGLTKTLNSKWPEQYKWETETNTQFRKRLEKRWRKAFSPLRQMLTIVREIGAERFNYNTDLKNDENADKAKVLSKLHIRICQVTAEIIALMEAGYADGAMARWRTLFEIETVMALVSTHDNNLAVRYLAHEIVESKKAADLYAESIKTLGFEPMLPAEIEALNTKYAETIANYGEEITAEYGWAALHVKKRKPNFFNLIEATGDVAMKSYYKMASYNVHAGAKGIAFKHGAMGGQVDLAGASNAGFEEPGQNTVCSLLHATSSLFFRDNGIDETIYITILTALRDKSIAEFMRAAEKLVKDEQQYRANQ